MDPQGDYLLPLKPPVASEPQGQDIGPAPEGQESRWFPDQLEDCEWPEACCKDVKVLCVDCPYYRPNH